MQTRAAKQHVIEISSDDKYNIQSSQIAAPSACCETNDEHLSKLFSPEGYSPLIMRKKKAGRENETLKNV